MGSKVHKTFTCQYTKTQTQSQAVTEPEPETRWARGTDPQRQPDTLRGRPHLQQPWEVHTCLCSHRGGRTGDGSQAQVLGRLISIQTSQNVKETRAPPKWAGERTQPGGKDRDGVWELSSPQQGDSPPKSTVENGLRYFPKVNKEISFWNVLSARSANQRHCREVCGEVGSFPPGPGTPCHLAQVPPSLCPASLLLARPHPFSYQLTLHPTCPLGWVLCCPPHLCVWPLLCLPSILPQKPPLVRA